LKCVSFNLRKVCRAVLTTFPARANKRQRTGCTNAAEGRKPESVNVSWWLYGVPVLLEATDKTSALFGQYAPPLAYKPLFFLAISKQTKQLFKSPSPRERGGKNYHC